jgi:hypothetical protein
MFPVLFVFLVLFVFFVLFVFLVLFSLLRIHFWSFFDASTYQLAFRPDDLPQFVTQFKILAVPFGNQVAGALQDIFDALQADFLVDELSGTRLKTGCF